MEVMYYKLDLKSILMDMAAGFPLTLPPASADIWRLINTRGFCIQVYEHDAYIIIHFRTLTLLSLTNIRNFLLSSASSIQDEQKIKKDKVIACRFTKLEITGEF